MSHPLAMFKVGDHVIETKAVSRGMTPCLRRAPAEVVEEDGHLVTTSDGCTYDARDGMAIPRKVGEYRAIMHPEWLTAETDRSALVSEQRKAARKKLSEVL